MSARSECMARALPTEPARQRMLWLSMRLSGEQESARVCVLSSVCLLWAPFVICLHFALLFSGDAKNILREFTAASYLPMQIDSYYYYY